MQNLFQNFVFEVYLSNRHILKIVFKLFILIPVPPPKFYVHVNPLHVNFDVSTLIWLNSFALNLHQSLLGSSTNPDPSSLPYIDVKVEALMLRVSLKSSVRALQ